MERPNPINEIRARHKLTQKEKRELEDASIISDDFHALARREACLANNEFHDAYFDGMSELYDKMEFFEDLLITTGPRRTLKLIDNILTKAAIAALFLMMFLGCTSC